MNDTNRRTTPPATETRSTAASSKTAHTPGPWTLRAVSCGIGCCEVFDVMAKYPEDETPDRRIAGVDGGNAVWLREGEADANARLIAAAPDMHALFVRLARRFHTGVPGEEDTDITAEARVILAAIEGRS